MAAPGMVQEMSDFLQHYPPFDQLGAEALRQLSAQVKLQFVPEGERLFAQGQRPLPHFFVVKKGSIRLLQDQSRLLDICDEGDVFGIRAVIGADDYLADALADEDSLLCLVPNEGFRAIIQQHPEVALYMAAGFASGVSVFKPEAFAETHKAQRAWQSKTRFQRQFNPVETIQVALRRTPVTCAPQTSIQAAAALMSHHNVGSILITDDQGLPLGILTDSDLRRKVVANPQAIKTAAVSTVMSSPVRTVKPQLSTAELTQAMMRYKITHLCVTTDGTPQTAALGIISQRDVLTAQGSSPALLVKEMLQTQEVAALAALRDKAAELVEGYVYQDLPMGFVSQVITEINDVLIQQAIRIAQTEMQAQGLPLPQLDFCFLALGSEGRKEQLLRTDQDSALIYQDPPPEEAEAVHQRFLALGQRIVAILEACGFERCRADMMASNPKWCASVSQWQQYFSQWVLSPSPAAVMQTTIFFDFRPIAGEEALADQLKQYIFALLDKQEVFLNFLAKNALQNPPPLSFFRNFIVEKGGDHKDAFDIKARAMMPLTDAARVLTYDQRLPGYGSTQDRFLWIATHVPALKDLAEASAMAYEILMRMRARHGFAHQDSGRYIHPENLNKLERQTLRNIFKTIEKLQQTLESRYRLAYFG
ncbi:DUF294 nucleotidyltransferase-like domain-containing protein [Eisenibacter elegans]|jgi:CBS domain-containing protein|uniref:DUF294 nucleotidyltransferase-like domain-containing protein n=1 Tax=Eisenibacter elegans TaxID=997 RepID=UPI0004132707|nr:DUF294 nucleotidyltransferase-like domain-containing protein [Eisenibacter elegans]